MAMYLGVKVNVKHVPRMSCEMAALADKLLRVVPGEEERKCCQEEKYEPVLGSILLWLNDPSLDLSKLLLQELKERIAL